jgi:uncharacterized protein YdcH (DUF465 family)
MNTLDQLAVDINQLDLKMNKLKSALVKEAWHLGAKLSEAKSQLDHGKFLPWLESNTKVSFVYANKYMRLNKDYPALLDNPNINKIQLTSLFECFTAPETMEKVLTGEINSTEAKALADEEKSKLKAAKIDGMREQAIINQVEITKYKEEIIKLERAQLIQSELLTKQSANFNKQLNDLALSQGKDSPAYKEVEAAFNKFKVVNRENTDKLITKTRTQEAQIDSLEKELKKLDKVLVENEVRQSVVDNLVKQNQKLKDDIAAQVKSMKLNEAHSILINTYKYHVESLKGLNLDIIDSRKKGEWLLILEDLQILAETLKNSVGGVK